MNREYKNRLIRHLNFLEEELKDYARFKQINRENYVNNRDERRNVERWIENIINSSVDISRVILTAEEIPIPDTYRGIVSIVSTVEGLEEAGAEELGKWVKLRNIIAHEYLDTKWHSIKNFIENTETHYKKFLEVVRHFLEKEIVSE